MSSVSCFGDFVKARDAVGLHLFITNERPHRDNHRERNTIALFGACRDGAPEICEVLIGFGADVNLAVVDYSTPLYIACKNAHPACVDVMLGHGADVNAGLSNRRTPLMATAEDINTMVRPTLDQFINIRCLCMCSLLAAGAAIDQMGLQMPRSSGGTALIMSTWNFRLAEILVKAGANVNIFNRFRLSALDVSMDVFELLLQHGADIDSVDDDGSTPLHDACRHLRLAFVDLLLSHGANMDVVNNHGCTALQVVMSGHPNSPERADVLKIIAAYAQKRFEESASDWIRVARHERIQFNIGVLMSSAGSFHDFLQAHDADGLRVFMTNERVALLKERDEVGLKVYMPNERHIRAEHLKRNNLALIAASTDGLFEICEVLINFGADVNNGSPMTPLKEACRNGHPACVDLLLAYGATVDDVNLDDLRTPLMIASHETMPDVKVGRTLDQFIENRCQCIHSLLDAGASIDQSLLRGGTALMHAAWNFQLAEILVRAGANVNIVDSNHNSAFQMACDEENLDVMRLFLENGAEIDADIGGYTQLHRACHFFCPTVIESLLSYCADIYILNSDGETALQVAISRSFTFPNRSAVLHLMAACAQRRFGECSADWCRLAQHECMTLDTDSDYEFEDIFGDA